MNHKTPLFLFVIFPLALIATTALSADKKKMPRQDVIEVPAIGEGLCVQSRWGYPEDIARAAAMLARGDLAYSTGQVVMVDGGLTLGRL